MHFDVYLSLLLISRIVIDSLNYRFSNIYNILSYKIKYLEGFDFSL